MKPKKKPTTAVMLDRICRGQNATLKELTRQIALNRLAIESLESGQSMLSERLESVSSDLAHVGNVLGARIDTLAPIVKHCERLLREKITLQDRAFTAEWKLANDYMAAPISENQAPIPTLKKVWPLR